MLLPRAVNCRPQTQTLFPIVLLSFPSGIPLPTVEDSGDSCAMQTKKTGAKRTPPTPSSSSSSSFLLMGQSRTVVPPPSSSFLPWWQSGGAGQGSFCAVARFTPIFSSFGRRQGLPFPPFVSSHSLLRSVLPNGRQKGEGSLDFVGIFMARRHRPARPFPPVVLLKLGGALSSSKDPNSAEEFSPPFSFFLSSIHFGVVGAWNARSGKVACE